MAAAAAAAAANAAEIGRNEGVFRNKPLAADAAPASRDGTDDSVSIPLLGQCVRLAGHLRELRQEIQWQKVAPPEMREIS